MPDVGTQVRDYSAEDASATSKELILETIAAMGTTRRAPFVFHRCRCLVRPATNSSLSACTGCLVLARTLSVAANHSARDCDSVEIADHRIGTAIALACLSLTSSATCKQTIFCRWSLYRTNLVAVPPQAPAARGGSSQRMQRWTRTTSRRTSRRIWCARRPPRRPRCLCRARCTRLDATRCCWIPSTSSR